ncbi:hypothetical protein [Maribacter sp. ACAM166]|uniref:hypothetical protein n=1 Tax=Maribacter sp. ACAM166 TaxID=2508996 RepID=UPI0010FE81BF|nr:hypothetical protein [Maribacter sp. ACAM166]TLP80799.1 hypothetical protein ES765_07025 [Maribacter sp. ACAM166]
MKITSTRIYKFFILYLIPSMFIVGCVEKDILDLDTSNINDIEEPITLESDLEITTITYNEIPSVIDDLFSNLGETNKQIVANKINHNNVIIDLKEIKKTIKKNTPGESSYSFALFVEGASINHIYNLIIEKDKKGKFKKYYVVGFEMEPEDINTFFMANEDYGQFKSTYRFYSFDSFFQDSKLKRVGKSGDCGSGTTGGSGDIQYNAPGTTLTNSYNGHIITTTFSNTTVSTTYNYNSTIVNNGTVNTVSTVATSGVVQVATNGPSAPIYTETVSAGTAQVSSSYNPQGSGGTPCTNTTTMHPDGGFTIKLCAVPDNNQNKSTLTAYGSDCTNGSGTFAINTAAKPINKLNYYLNGTFTYGQFEWFSDPDHLERVAIAKELVWFLIDNGNTSENIEFVLMAIDAVMDEGSVDVDVDVDDRIINTITFPCPSDVVEEANKADNPIAQKIMDSFRSQGGPDLIYSNTDIPQDNPDGHVLGRTIPTTNSQGNIMRINIELDNDFLIDATDLSIFATVIHENIHALMYYQLSNAGITIDNPDIDYSYLANEWSKYVAHVEAGVPQNQILTDLALQQHQIMGELVLESAQIIQNYGNLKGYNVSDNTAQALAWAGLQSSTGWTLLDEIVKQNYKNIIDDESTGFEILAIGSPCN